MHDQSTPSQPGTTETVVTRAACATIGALGLAAAIGLSSGGHDILGASLGIVAAAGVILIDHLAVRRRRRAHHAALMARLDPTPLSDRSDDLSIPPFAPPPHGADKRDPAPVSPPSVGSRTPLLPPGLKAPVMNFSPLVQAALLVLADADDIPHRDGLAGVELSNLTRLRRAVAAEIETRARAAAAYPRAPALTVVDLKALGETHRAISATTRAANRKSVQP